MRREREESFCESLGGASPSEASSPSKAAKSKRSPVAVDLGSSDWTRRSDGQNGGGTALPSSLAVPSHGAGIASGDNAADTGLHLRHRHLPSSAAPSGFRGSGHHQHQLHHQQQHQQHQHHQAHHNLPSVRQRANRDRDRDLDRIGNNKSNKSKCKPVLQLLLLSTSLGYLLFLYAAHRRYRHSTAQSARDDRDLDIHRDLERWQLPLPLPLSSPSGQGRFALQGSQHHHQHQHQHRHDVDNDEFDDDSRRRPRVSSFAFVPQSFRVDADLPPYEEPSTPAFRRAEDWASRHIQNWQTRQSLTMERRRRRTTPPSNGGSSTTPRWYRLDHLAPDAIATWHRRWRKQNDDMDRRDNHMDERGNPHDHDDDPINPDSFPLCGAHAKDAAKHHPQNYHPSAHTPLGPTSRVLVTGILSPLGMRLALALHRQCNVTDFAGLDAEIPNDPLARLEQQERLAVLVSELGDARNFQPLKVPFLGLEGRTTKRGERHRHRNQRDETKPGRGNDNAGTSFQMFGIEVHPGMDPHGAGALDALREYRPTHVVHLAGTQADALLNPKNAPRATSATTKEEEEDHILVAGISSRPHLFELRMGTTGMEQLLAGVVAQNADEFRSDDDSRKTTTTPHVVYASSYDAHYFAETSSRLNGNIDSGTTDEGGANENPLGWHPSSSSSSSSSWNSGLRPPRGLHGLSRLVDELLASTYFALHGVTSVGLRFDAIYGPRGFGVPSTSVPIYNVHRIRNGGGVSPDVDLAETAVRRLYRKWMAERTETESTRVEHTEDEDSPQVNLIEEAGWSHAAHDPRDFVFVDDAVNAIIAAMQYRSTGDSPITFNIGSGEMESLSSLSEEIQYLTSDDNDAAKTDGKSSLSKSVIDVERSSAARSASLDSNEYLRWSATTSLPHGAAKLLAWHLDRALPFFPPAPKPEDGTGEDAEVASPAPKPLDGQDILSKRGIRACVHGDDPTCLYEAHTALPCASECSTKTCVPSVFDSVLSLSRDVTEGCEVVLYTMSLGADIHSLDLRTVYNDGEEFEKWGEPSVCTLAYIPSDSTLARNIIDKVPPASLAKMNISAESDLKTKLKVLNGHLVHQGWVLIFVDNAIEPLTAEDVYLPKITPGLLFHSSVFRALFVDENFNISPTPEDAQFLTSEMARGKVKKRTVMGPDAKGRKVKYKLPEEPQRRAVLLVAPMKEHPAEGDKINLREVSKLMMKEIGLKSDEHEPKEIRVQREYYERAKSLINSFDLRTLLPVARHKLEIKDFIRSRWVIHDMRLEEAHQLRCEWYREHIKWNTHLDQLSFSYVMAKRELTRKIITEQPLETESEKLTLLQMVINTRSDAKEWHPIFSGEGTRLPIHHSQISPEEVPQNLFDLPDNEIDEVDTVIDDNDESSNTYYVRIMSDKVMLDCRKRWTKARDERRKMISFQRKKQRQLDQKKQNQQQRTSI
ncbi:hypothetical protein ACHAXS_009235 [Conticribra weissflogii]